MAKRFVDDAAVAKFTEAIKAVEAESSVEVVIKVRHHSGSYLHADLIAVVDQSRTAAAELDPRRGRVEYVHLLGRGRVHGAPASV